MQEYTCKLTVTYSLQIQAETKEEVAEIVNHLPALLASGANILDVYTSTQPPEIKGVTTKAKGVRAKATTPLLEIQERLFTRFWATYPKKVSEQEARKEFRRLKPDETTLKTMLNAIEKQEKSYQWQKDNGRYIPNPNNWLKGQKWQDNLEAVKTAQRPSSYNLDEMENWAMNYIPTISEEA